MCIPIPPLASVAAEASPLLARLVILRLARLCKHMDSRF